MNLTQLPAALLLVAAWATASTEMRGAAADDPAEADVAADKLVPVVPTAKESTLAGITAVGPISASSTAVDRIPTALTAVDRIPADLTAVDRIPAALTTVDPTSAALTAVDRIPAALTTVDPTPAALTAVDRIPAALTAVDPTPAALTAVDRIPAALTAVDPIPAALANGSLPADVVASDSMVTDYRFVSHTELLSSEEVFSPHGVTRFSEIIFDIQKYQMIVGASDHLYRLSVKGLQVLEATHWPASAAQTTLCENKGQPSADCRNFIRVLHRRGDRLLACGTNAFHPQCSWRSMAALGTVLANRSGIAVCPYSPRLNVTSLLTSDGDLLAATATDFSGLDPTIYRAEGRSRHLRTAKYDSRLLSQPQFVGSFETAEHVYFVFREEAGGQLGCGKRVTSRIGRVCKNDPGNRRGTWTTFVKARLNCSVSGEYPFYLDQVQGVHYLDREEILYAAFTTPENSLAGSAVCAFPLTSITAAFDGPFRRRREPGGVRQRHESDLGHFQCRSTGDTPGRQLTEVWQHVFMDRAVQPNRVDPLYLVDGSRLVAITADVVTTQHHVAVHVLFVADTDGIVRKLSVVPRSLHTCVLEVLQPFARPTQILTMKLLKEAGSVYLGTDTALVRVPVHRCDRYTNEDSCLGAADPYCGWDVARQLCGRPDGRGPDAASWRQPVTQCPDLTRPVAGGWSGWADWHRCRQVAAGRSGPAGDQCLCRRRACASPAPANGGADCRGLADQVTNCTRHGRWTGWSAWSACSQPCGVAVKSRRRSCTGPAPAHGGRPCVGEESQQIMCHSNPPCPSKANLPVDGGWGDWGGWGRCSARCGGGGFRRRRRTCDSPRPVNGGRHCLDCPLQYAECGGQPCPELRRLSPWTPWLAANGSDAGHQQRFRFTCLAPVSDERLIGTGALRTDERHCSSDGVCSRADSVSAAVGWSAWSDWTECSLPCGGGDQTRFRTCGGGGHHLCLGPNKLEQKCNTLPCYGSWTCWSSWSSCSATCGAAHRERRRLCRRPTTSSAGASTCLGDATAREPCSLQDCASVEGWHPWSVWSDCDGDEQQQRQRRCRVTAAVCHGSGRNTRLCVQTSPHSAQERQSGWRISSGAMAGACLVCFAIGALLAALAAHHCLHRGRSQRVKSSKYYSSPQPQPAEPNAYVSLADVHGVHELAELRSHCRREGSLKHVPPPDVSFGGAAATVRDGDGDRRGRTSDGELSGDLDYEAPFDDNCFVRSH